MRSRCQFTLATIFSLVLASFVAIAQAAEVYLAWDSPLDTTNVTIAGYRIYWKLAGGTYGEQFRKEIKDPKATSIIISNLEEGKTYHFVATAFDTFGNESEFSNEIITNIPLADTDGDGITDRDERETYGTDPLLADSDSDGLNDHDELTTHDTDPLLADSDSDGLNDHDELKTHSTNPLQADTDGDGVSDGDELAGGSDPANPASRPSPPQATLPLETGEVQVNHTWSRVAFSQPFVNPVVVATPLSTHGPQPATVRIRNVKATGFELRLQEWDYLDGSHTTETVGYLVLEHGHHTLPDGTQLEAGRFTTNHTTSFAAVPFQHPFATPPVVLTAVTTVNEATAVTGRLHNLARTGFAFRLQEQERNPQTHATETIAYIAWEPAAGSINGRPFEVARTPTVVTDQKHTLLFQTAFSDTPVLLADMQTTNGTDPATLRWANKDLAGVDVQVSEEQSADSELTHEAEVVGYLLLAPAAVPRDTDGDGLSDTEETVRYGTDPARFDSDDDQLNDGIEVRQLETNPLNADSDDDGLEDGEEVQFYATEALNADSDGDGLEDGEEVLQGTDPLVVTSAGPSPTDDGESSPGEEEEEPAPAPPAAGTTVLGIRDRQFTLNGVPTFLYGITYAAGLGAPQTFIAQDLDDMQRFGINWLRVWATRHRFDHDTSAVDATGHPRPAFMAKLQWLLAECERRGMVVDITLSRRDQPAFYDLALHRQAVKTLATELRAYRNWYLDLANERNGEVSFSELRQLRNAVKELDPQRLVTASHSLDISPADLQQYLFTAQVDFLTPHRQRSPEASRETEVVTRRYFEHMAALGRVVPVHYQEPIRRGYSSWQPEAVDLIDNLRLSWQGGAAGWCFHNGDQRNPLLTPHRDPRRSADLRERRLFDQLDSVERRALEEMQDFAESRIFHN
jgi:Bacterial TSP3 repeat/Fibronectin type III domain